MTTELNKKIKKLAGVLETNALLDYELSGYMKDSDGRKMFRGFGKHKVIPKKKFTYIDQETSGKFLVQNADDKIAKAGTVWRIKAYGQKKLTGVRSMDQALAEETKKQEQLKKRVMERALKNRK